MTQALHVPDALPLLSRGHHRPGSGRACAMETLSVLMGTPEDGDRPRTVHPLLAAVVATVNDAMFDDERQQLWTVLLDLPGTAMPRAPGWKHRAEVRHRDLALATACARAGWEVLAPTRRWRGEPLLSSRQRDYAAQAAGGATGRRAAEQATLRMAERAAQAGLGLAYIRAVLRVLQERQPDQSAGAVAPGVRLTATWPDAGR